MACQQQLSEREGLFASNVLWHLDELNTFTGMACFSA